MSNIPQPCQWATAPIQSCSEAASGPALPVEQIVHPMAPVNLTDMSAPSTLSPYFSAWREMSLSYGCPVCLEYSNRGYIFRCAQTPARGATGYAHFEKVQPPKYARLRLCTRHLKPALGPGPILFTCAVVVILQDAVCRPFSARVCLLYDSLAMFHATPVKLKVAVFWVESASHKKSQKVTIGDMNCFL